MPRESVLARTFVELADTLVDDFDVVDLLTLLADRCVDSLVAAALMVAARTASWVGVLELLEVGGGRAARS